MRAMYRRAVLLGLFAFLVLAPRTASAITLDQVVALAKAGVTDTVILALIDRDRTVFAIEPEQIPALQRDGLSERVILAMLKSGRDEGEQAARSDAAANAAWIASNLATEPQTIIVGHGPDRPNTPHLDGFYSGPTTDAFLAAPYAGPTLRYRKPQPLASRRSTEPRALCYARISTSSTTNLMPFVTFCPDVMQPSRR
jgi:hypothetical protein